MNVRWLLLCLTALLCLSPEASATEEVVEAWRSSWFYGPESTSVNPADGSCWVATDYDVVHLSADGLITGHTGGFWGPAFVSVNPADGSCWVADTYNHQVVHLAPDGAELWRGGGFDYPWSVSAYPTDGSCWVGQGHYDWENGVWLTSAVLHLSSDGTELWRGEDFEGPVWVSVNPSDGSCWIAVYGNWDGDLGQQTDSAVVHLSADGTELWRGGGFNGAVSASVNPADGSCWVADSGSNEVVHLDADGSELWRGGAFESPWCVSVNPTDGSCWVSDLSHNEVVHLGADGAELWRGGGFDQPFGLCVNPTDGSCWVPDLGNNRVIHLDEDGGHLSTSRGYGQPQSVSVNPTDGSCWAATDTARNEVVHLSEDGAELWRGGDFYWPLSVSVNPTDGSCWVADSENNRVVHLADDGSWLWGGSGGLIKPTSVSVDPTDGSCWVTGYNDNEVVHLAEDGAELCRAQEYLFGDPLCVSVNPADGSCWVADSHSLHLGIHHLANGCSSVWGGDVGVNPCAVSVNSADGSCWVAVRGEWDGSSWAGACIVHLDEDGTELWRGTSFQGPNSVSVNSADGSCWVADTGVNEVAHLAEDGSELWRGGGFSVPWSVSVNPTDGSCWVADKANWQVVHLVIGAQGSHDVSVTASCDPNTVGSGGTTSCTADFYDSQGHGVASWSWHDGGAGGTFTPSPGVQSPAYTAPVNTTASNLIVTLTVSATCDGPAPLSDSDSCSLTVAPGVVAEAGPDKVIGSGGSTTLEGSASGGVTPYSYSWSPGTGLSSTTVAQPTASPANTTVYTLTVTDDIGQTDSDSVTVTVAPGVVAEAGPDKVIGSGGSTTLEGSASGGVTPYSYSWSPGTGLSSTTVAQPTASPASTTVYTLTVTDDTDQTDTDSVTVTVLDSFDDVPPDYWAHDEILACVAAGIVFGYDDGLYHPEQPVDRGQMAVYVARAVAGGDGNVPGPSVDPGFTDVDGTHWAYKYICYAVDQNVVQGYPEGDYRPDQAVTRDQMAVYVARALVAPWGEAAVPDPGCTDPPFPDVRCDFWARKHVQHCMAEGVVQGYDDGHYHPEYVVTRDQMAVYVARAFDLLP